jgi:hypothetical protein
MTNEHPTDGPQQPNPWLPEQPAPGQPAPAYPAPGPSAPGQPAPAYPAPGQPMPGQAVPAPTGQTPYGYAYPGYPYPVARRTNGLAIASLVVSIAAFFVCLGVGSAVGAILGHVARKQISQRGEDGAGMALAGIIIGWIGTAIGVLFVGLWVLIVVAASRSNG